MKRFKDRGGQIVSKTQYLDKTTSFKSIIEKLLKISPDTVFMPGYPRDSGYMIKQSYNMGFKTVFLGDDGWSDDLYEYAGDALHGHYYSTHWHKNASYPKSRTLIKALENKNYPGATGNISFDETGSPIKPAVILKFANNTSIFVKSIAP